MFVFGVVHNQISLMLIFGVVNYSTSLMLVFAVIPNTGFARFMLVLRLIHDTVRFMLIFGDVDLRCGFVTVVRHINDTCVGKGHREHEADHDGGTMYSVDAVQNALLVRISAPTFA